MDRVYGLGAKRARHKSISKQRGSVTYITDRGYEVSKMFIICLRGVKILSQTEWPLMIDTR